MATKRNYQPNWEKEFSWLEYRDGKMFCSVCCKAKMENTFTSGCTNFKRSTILQHVSTNSTNASFCQHAKALKIIKMRVRFKKTSEIHSRRIDSMVEKQEHASSCNAKEDIPKTKCSSLMDLQDGGDGVEKIGISDSDDDLDVVEIESADGGVGREEMENSDSDDDMNVIEIKNTDVGAGIQEIGISDSDDDLHVIEIKNTDSGVGVEEIGISDSDDDLDVIEIKNADGGVEEIRMSDSDDDLDVIEIKNSIIPPATLSPTNSFRSYADLPDDVLFHIFSYLTFEERWRISQVCHRWYNIARSIFHEDVDIVIKNPYRILKLLPYLPASVKHLRLSSHSVNARPLCFSELMDILYKFCPQLKTLVLKKLLFSKIVIRQTELEKQELRVLSLTKCNFAIDFLQPGLSSLMPTIKVLDLSHAMLITKYDLPFFSSLHGLEELYLTGCQLMDNGSFGRDVLKTLKNLKVLDLEGTGYSNRFLDIIRYGQHLEKVYLASTLVCDNDINFASPLQQLQTICLCKTSVTLEGIKKLLILCPSLQNVIVTLSNDMEIMSRDHYKHIRSKLIYKESQDPGIHLPYCDHFEKDYCHHRWKNTLQ